MKTLLIIQIGLLIWAIIIIYRITKLSATGDHGRVFQGWFGWVHLTIACLVSPVIGLLWVYELRKRGSLWRCSLIASWSTTAGALFMSLVLSVFRVVTEGSSISPFSPFCGYVLASVCLYYCIWSAKRHTKQPNPLTFE